MKAATPINAINGFRKCGIAPYNPDIFKEEYFLTSSVSDIPVEEYNGQDESPSKAVDVSDETDKSEKQHPQVSPHQIRPLPKLSNLPKKRAGVKRGRTAILTSSPVKNALMATISKNKKQKSSSIKQVTELKSSKQYSKESSQVGSSGDDTPCLYCNELYQDRCGHGWAMCIKCKRWAHEACAGIEDDDDDFTCELCCYYRVM